MSTALTIQLKKRPGREITGRPGQMKHHANVLTSSPPDCASY